MHIYILADNSVYTGVSYEYAAAVVPYRATNVSPPEEQEGFARRFNRQATVWEYVPLEDLQPPPISLEEAKAQKIVQIDAETSSAITAGFDHEVADTSYHFSYDTFDQQNFVDSASVATLVLSGAPAPGMAESVTWNAYTVPEGHLARLIFTPSEFLGLYTMGALAHKGIQMEIGGARKAAVEAAKTTEEVNAI